MTVKLLILLSVSVSVLSSETRFLNITEPIFDETKQARNIVCNPQTNCLAPNNCVENNSVCMCAAEYANFVIPGTETTTPVYCSYERKKQLTAFLLQFFIWCAGQFYMGNIQYAIPQLIMILFPCVICCASICLKIGMKNQTKTGGDIFLIVIQCLISCASCAWWLADAIIFGTNGYVDKNGIYPQNW
jgi:hypothetical protein